jgi:hypothetical protein
VAGRGVLAKRAGRADGPRPGPADLASTGRRAPSILGWQSSGSSQQLAFNTGHDPAAWVTKLLNLAPKGITAPVSVTAQSPLRYVPAIATSVPAAAVGVLAGTGLARLMVPGITLTADAAYPVPPALPVLPLGLAAALAVVTAALPAAAAALSVARRPDPVAQLRAEAR